MGVLSTRALHHRPQPPSLQSYFLLNLANQEGPWKAHKYRRQCGHRGGKALLPHWSLRAGPGRQRGSALEEAESKFTKRWEQSALRSISKWQITSFSFSRQPFSSSVASFFLSFLFSPLFLLCSPLDKISRTINNVEINNSTCQSVQYWKLARVFV